MKLYKFIVILSALLLVSGMAWAGNTPEYDAVGTDTCNFYSGSIIYYQAVNFGPNRYLERDSAFPAESFWTNAGQLQYSPCYSCNHQVMSDALDSERFFFEPPLAALTDVWNQGTYKWSIVLQMKPEADINLNIYDCVLKHNETWLYEFADQTGRYRMPWGELMFNAAWNPLVSATAFPGPFATAGFPSTGLILDARTLPGLVSVPLDGVSYTSKAHWPEGLVIAAPKTGNTNGSGQMEYNLKQGDLIHVTVEIPPDSNTVDVWYGPESVVLKYIGIINTEYFASGGEG
jgi:hypothetical protein